MFLIFGFNIPQWLEVLSRIITGLGVFILFLAIFQLNKNLSPFPTPKSNSQLVENGLYKFIRHPIYTGILLSFLGFAIYSQSSYRLLITMVLYALFFIKSQYEEKQLVRRFDNYSAYKKKAGRFFPKIFRDNR